ncbi:ABC transporter permease [Abyssibius alkaniclasticus]|uniref:ABC transporter permease n=1 Tax=Abyssibius alkaniclasticus TaxID=2881234 RepID=UPI002363CA12|nr:ABC transporter permease [Abyssibius alkaniclasticus]UPH72653.1 ABC transporter permease [Abyssibius alkaniclasticus]
MDLSSIDPISLIASLMIAATPILLAGLGELVVEKSGVLNLGVEGMMIIGAIAGFAMAVETENPYLGMLAAMGAGAVLALLFGILTQYLLSNQVATGLALTLFGLGLAALLGHSYTGLKPPAVAKLDIAFLTDIPVLGRILFNHDAVVYFSIFMVVALWWFLNRSRAGLVLRAVGESHDAAHSLGYNVVMIRMGAILFGGAMAGLGGAYFSLIRVPQWTEGMTAGAGWIALALVVFASWKPGRLLIGAYLFGGISVLEINLQIAGAGISPAYLKMTPYLVTIIVLVIMSSDRRRASLNAPASLGRSFHASH